MTIEGVIPNSQVIIVPWQPQDVHDSSTWTKQLFLMPGRWIPWVGITLITTIVILAITVLFLHLNEKVSLESTHLAHARLKSWLPLQRQDELERRRGMHLINFDGRSISTRLTISTNICA